METGLLDHDHSEMDRLLANFSAALAQRDTEASFLALDFFWARLAVHIRAEHLQLFPALLHAAEAGPGNPTTAEVREITDQLRHDHDFFMVEFFHLMKLLRAQRKLGAFEESAAQALGQRVNGVKERLQRHNAREETQVYRWAALLLSPPECSALNERMQQELLNLPPRYRQA